MDDQLVLKNRLKVARAERSLSQGELAKLVGEIGRASCRERVWLKV